jgi:peptidylprolyl isomerase
MHHSFCLPNAKSYLARLKILNMSTAKQGDKVQVHYTGRLTTGEQFDSSAGRDPLEFTVGAGQMISGFDAGVEGMGIGDKKTINIPAHEAYGEWHEENVIEFPKESIPADMVLEVGMELMLRDQQGRPVPVRVHEVLEEVVRLDANHQLAGKELVFDIELVSVNGDTGQSRIILLD